MRDYCSRISVRIKKIKNRSENGAVFQDCNQKLLLLLLFLF